MKARTWRVWCAALAWIWVALLPLGSVAGTGDYAAKALAVDNYQGLWWNPNESGWGINFAHQGDTIFATWFTYDTAGKPAWLIAVLDKKAAGSYGGPVSSVTGPAFDTLPWDSARIAEHGVGTMTVSFADSGHASLVYTVNGVTQTKAIVPQDFGGPARCTWNSATPLDAATNYTDLWWNADESGWGVNFTHQGDVVFATWFTYDPSGKPWWLIAALQKTADGPYTGDVSTVTGPGFGATWDPAKVKETVVGTATAIFADGNTAQFSYTVNGVSQSKLVARQVFVAPGTVCTGGGNSAVGFDLSPRPQSVLLVPGETRDAHVAIRPHGGFAGTVRLALSGLPPGVSYRILPEVVTIADGAVAPVVRLTVSGSAAVTISPATVAVSATAGDGRSASATLVVGIAAQGDPIAARLATFAAVEQYSYRLDARNLSPSVYLQELAAFMAGRSDYAATGVDLETMNAWGRFKDGHLHIVEGSFRPPTVTATSATGLPAAGHLQPRAEGAELPGTARALLLHPFGADYPGQKAIDQMRGYLQAKGWKVDYVNPSGEAGVAALMWAGSRGFFYLNTHGGRVRMEDPNVPDELIYALWTSTVITPERESSQFYTDERNAHRLESFTARTTEGIWNPVCDSSGDCTLEKVDNVRSTNYGITHHFVRKYMKFASDGVAFINACWSSRNADFVRAFVDPSDDTKTPGAGAGAYLGWSEKLSAAAAYAAAPYFVDRMVGANMYRDRESPPQRAFRVDLVLQDMLKTGYAYDRETIGVIGELSATMRTGIPYPPIFAPSIRYVQVDEALGQMTLVGEFGEDTESETGTVTVGGVKVAIVKWSPNEILTALPLKGPGSSGDVVVWVRGVRSNARQLTEWTVPLTYTWTNAHFHPGQRYDGSGFLRLRADVGGYRTVPGEKPKFIARGGMAASDSLLDVTGSGAYTSGGCTATLSGTGHYLSPIARNGTTGPVLANGFQIAGDTKKALIGLAPGAPLFTHTQTYTGGPGCKTGTEAAAPAMSPLDGYAKLPQNQADNPPTIPLPAVQFSLTSVFGIPAETRAAPVGTGSVTVSWSAAGAGSPPRDTADAGK